MSGDGDETNAQTAPINDPNAIEALACFGLTPDPANAMPTPTRQPRTCDLWPEHVQALNLLAACQSQWRPLTPGMAGLWWRGALWTDVAQAMEFLEVPKKERPNLWQQYRVMEPEALSVLQKEADKAASK